MKQKFLARFIIICLFVVLSFNLLANEINVKKIEVLQKSTNKQKEQLVSSSSENEIDESKEDFPLLSILAWSSLGVGSLSLVAGAIIINNSDDPNTEPFGISAFSTGILLETLGGILLYLDSDEEEEF